jgi:glycosyltransferase 2 family protein
METKNANAVHRRRIAALCWSAGLSVLAVIALLLLVEIDVGRFSEMAARLNAWLAIGLIALFCGVQMFRVLRLQVLLQQPVRFLDLLAAVLVHQFLASLLPWKLGELSLPMLLRRNGVRVSESLAVLLLSRVLDLLVVALLFGGSLCWFWPSLPPGLRQTWPLAAALIGVAAALLAGGFAARAWRSGCSLTAEGAPATGVWQLGRQLLESFRRLQRGQIVRGAGYTAGMWSASTAFNLWFCLAFASRIDPGAAVVVVLMIPLINQLPIRGLAGIGTTEAVAVVMFTGAGLSAAEALALGVWGHVFHFGLIAAGGLLGLAIRLASGRRDVAADSLALIPTDAS